MRSHPAFIAISLLLACATCAPPAPAPPIVQVAASAAPSSAPVSTAAAACERGTARLLGSLREPLQVTTWVTPGIPNHAALAREVDLLFARYERLAPGRVHHRIVEIRDDAQRRAAKDDGLEERSFGETDGPGAARVERGFLGISLKYRTEKEAFPIFPAPEEEQGADYRIATKIRDVRNLADDVRIHVGVITGKGEIAISESNLVATPSRPGASIKSIMEQALPFYRFVDVDLQGDVDGALDALLVTQPGRDYTDAELRRIDAYLTQGNKALAVLAGAANIQEGDGTLTATLDTHGLEKLLAGYGVEVRRDVILDWGRPAYVKVQSTTGPITIAHPAILHAPHDARARPEEQPLDPMFPGFFRMDDLAFPFSSTLVPHPERQPAARLRVAARTSPRATVLTRSPVAMKPASGGLEPIGDQAARAIAVALDGEIQSAFGGNTRGHARLLVVSASQFLTNPYARAGNPRRAVTGGATGGDEELLAMSMPYAQAYLTATILAFRSSLDWLTSDEDLVACAAVKTKMR